jgi:hypothetical protein
MRRRSFLTLVATGAIALVGLGVASGAMARNDDLARVRAATSRFHSLSQATAAGYGPFYVCTEQPGVGTMGQHYVKGSLVEDPAVDLTKPEALVYEPKPNGGYRLVALEYVVIAATLPAGASAPTVLGRPMTFVPAGNRYGLPDFYQRHVWLYDRNPRGLLDDWNPTVSCRGNGDDGG